jgi:hypothetical protein
MDDIDTIRIYGNAELAGLQLRERHTSPVHFINSPRSFLRVAVANLRHGGD